MTQTTFKQKRIIDVATKSLPVALFSPTLRRARGPLAGLLRGHALYPVFQPIVSLSEGSIHSHEALIKGPQNTSFHTPDTLLAAAVQENISEFADQAVALFDEPARQAGGIQADDRYGVPRFFPLTTLAIGAVTIQRDTFATSEEVASAAARAKHDAKVAGEGLFIQTSLSN